MYYVELLFIGRKVNGLDTYLFEVSEPEFSFVRGCLLEIEEGSERVRKEMDRITDRPPTVLDPATREKARRDGRLVTVERSKYQ